MSRDSDRTGLDMQVSLELIASSIPCSESLASLEVPVRCVMHVHGGYLKRFDRILAWRDADTEAKTLID
jgi:hypothetical protein